MWDVKRAVVVFSILGFLFIIVNGQLLNPSRRYCYNFTWLGPKYNNESTFDNATCDDVTRLSKGIPCLHPLVVTIDGSYPDIDFLWENHDVEVTCLMTSGEVCASYSYRFDGGWENITYMCTKVMEDNGKSVTDGCYTEYNGNREITICICKSNPGKPCNSASININSIFLFVAGFWIINFLKQFFTGNKIT